MINIMMVLVVSLLQSHKDILGILWPIAAEVRIITKHIMMRDPELTMYKACFAVSYPTSVPSIFWFFSIFLDPSPKATMGYQLSFFSI